MAWAAVAADGETTTLYFWESPSGTVAETGGTIAYVNGDNSTRLNAKGNIGNAKVIVLNGKSTNIDDEAASDKAGHMVITLEEALKEGDQIKITGYRWKNADGKSVSIYMRLNANSIFDGVEGGSYWTDCCADANNEDYDNDGATPSTYTWTVPASGAGSEQIELTRSAGGTNLFITKIAITGVRSSESGTDPDPVTATYTYDYDFSNETGVVGDLPTGASEVEHGTTITLPGKIRNYYVAGKTQTGWSDGTSTYNLGATVTLKADKTFTPVYATNTTSLEERTSPVTLDYLLKKSECQMAYETSETKYLVCQASVNGKTIDVPITFAGGKVNNASSTDALCQVNSGTTWTVPAAEGATYTIKSSTALSSTTFGGSTDYTGSTTTTYTYNGSESTLAIVTGSESNSYWEYIQVVLPAVSSEEPEPVEYAETKNSDGVTYFNGSEVTTNTYDLTGASISFASDTWSYTEYTSLDGFTGFWSGKNNPNNGGSTAPTTGSALRLTPTASNALAVYVVVNASKAIYVLEDDTQIGFTIGETTYECGSMLSEKTYGAIKFNVTAGKSYSVFCTGSKMGFFGFKAIDRLAEGESGSGSEPGTDPEPTDPTDTTTEEIADKAPAFPGAEGYGRYTTGGRGGTIYHVTTLEDYCDNGDYSESKTKDTAIEGSLRYGINKVAGARTIVFDVAGTIELKAPLKIANGNLSILGQTAPGDGITLKNYTLSISASNVIIRYIRCRMGDEGLRYWKNGSALTDKEQYVEDDAMNSSHQTSEEIDNVIIDHCSISWSVDECGSFYGNRNFSLQWCILSESLRISHHEKGTHGYGGIWGGERASFHHNLIANHDSRNPRFDHGYVSTLAGPVDYINNVVYNWGGNSTYGGENKPGCEAKKHNMINNYYKAGPYTQTLSTKNRLLNPTTQCSNCNSSDKTNVVPGQFYLAGNYMNGTEVTTVNTTNFSFESNCSVNTFTSTMKLASQARPAEGDFAQSSYTTLHSAPNAYASLLDYVGASHARDAVDIRVINDMKNGTYIDGSKGSTKGLIDSPSDVGGWPTLAAGTPIIDTDHDGMPDDWETAQGLNPSDAADALSYSLDTKGWYTNLEVYANSLVEADIKAQNSKALNALNEYYPALNSEEEEPATGIPGEFTWNVSDGTTVDNGSSSTPRYVRTSTLNPAFSITSSQKISSDSRFKLNEGESAIYTLNIPDNIVVSEVVFTNCSENYYNNPEGNYLTTTFTVASQGATVETKDANGNALQYLSTGQTITSTLTGHTAGTPITFVAAGGKQLAFGSIKLTYTVLNPGSLTLVSTSAEEGAALSASGSIAFTFSGDVTLCEGASVKVDGNAVRTVANGAVVTGYYWKLAYGSTGHTVTFAKNSVVDVFGNKNAEDVSFTFSIAERTAVTRQGFDFVVGVDGTIDEAIAAANAASGTSRYLIFVPNGTYQLTGNQQNAMTHVTRANVSIIGQSQEGALLTNQPTEAGISSTSTLEFRKDNCYLQDLTLKNGFDYGASGTYGVAVAYYDRGQKNVLKNVSVLSNQDTFTSAGSRGYFESCDIAGTVDFICGSGDYYFNGCDIIINDRSTANVITAPATLSTEQWGYVFEGCTVKGENASAVSHQAGKYNLGRPWKNAPASTFLNTQYEMLPSNAGWTNMTSSLVCRFHEYGSTDAQGSTVSLTSRNISACSAASGSDAPVLTAAQAAEYTLYNVVGGTDGWDPTELTAQVAAPADVKLYGKKLVWADDEEALCYVVFKNGTYYANTTEASLTVEDATATWTVRAANRCGGLGQTSDAATVASLEALLDFIKSHGDLVVAEMAEADQAAATALDINGDGKVTVSDVTKLIDVSSSLPN